MKHSICLALLILLIPAAGSAGTREPEVEQGHRPTAHTGTRLPEQTKMTAEQLAVSRHKTGIRHQDNAANLAQIASSENNQKKLASLQSKIDKAYNKSINAFEKAIKLYPRYYQAYGSLGYSLRKVGRIDESLAAYDRALAINPSYGHGIADRAEAYLGLNRLDDAKQAYMSLARSQPALADQLLAAMTEWVASQRAGTGESDPVVIARFAAWIDQQPNSRENGQ